VLEYLLLHTCAVTHSTVTEDKEEVEQEMSTASHPSPTNKRNVIGMSNSTNNNEATFSSYLQDYKSTTLNKTTHKYVSKKINKKQNVKVKT
jgi:hypothetical protein